MILTRFLNFISVSGFSFVGPKFGEPGSSSVVRRQGQDPFRFQSYKTFFCVAEDTKNKLEILSLELFFRAGLTMWGNIRQ